MAVLVAIAIFTLGEFNFQPPSGWSMKAVANGYDATGPGAAMMRVRVYAVRGGTADAVGRAAAKKVRGAALAAVELTVRDNALVEQMPLRTKRLKAGQLDESLYTTSDSLGYLAVYMLTGQRSVVVTTVEGSATQIKQIVPVRSAFVTALGGER